MPFNLAELGNVSTLNNVGNSPGQQNPPSPNVDDNSDQCSVWSLAAKAWNPNGHMDEYYRLYDNKSKDDDSLSSGICPNALYSGGKPLVNMKFQIDRSLNASHLEWNTPTDLHPCVENYSSLQVPMVDFDHPALLCVQNPIPHYQFTYYANRTVTLDIVSNGRKITRVLRTPDDLPDFVKLNTECVITTFTNIWEIMFDGTYELSHRCLPLLGNALFCFSINVSQVLFLEFHGVSTHRSKKNKSKIKKFHPPARRYTGEIDIDDNVGIFNVYTDFNDVTCSAESIITDVIAETCHSRADYAVKCFPVDRRAILYDMHFTRTEVNTAIRKAWKNRSELIIKRLDRILKGDIEDYLTMLPFQIKNTIDIVSDAAKFYASSKNIPDQAVWDRLVALISSYTTVEARLHRRDNNYRVLLSLPYTTSGIYDTCVQFHGLENVEVYIDNFHPFDEVNGFSAGVHELNVEDPIEEKQESPEVPQDPVQNLLKTVRDMGDNDYSVKWLMNLIENSVSLGIVLHEGISLSAKMAAIILYIKACIGDPNSSIYGIVYDYVMTLVEPSPEICQGFTTKIRDGYRQVTSHPLTRHLSTLVGLGVAVNFLKTDYFTIKGFKLFNADLGKEIKNDGNLIDTVLTTLGFFFDHGYDYFTTGTTQLFTARDEISQFQYDVAFLKSHMIHVKQGNYGAVTEGKSVGHFAQLLRATCELSRTIIPVGAFTPVLLSKLRADLVNVRNEYDLYLRTSKPKINPMSILVYGASGVGKTPLAIILGNILNQALNLPFGDEFTCSLEPDSEWQENMRSDIAIIQMDDIANAKLTAPGTKNDSGLTIKLMNNAPAYARMPEAQDKGRVLMQPDLVLGSANLKDLDARNKSNCPASMVMRWKFVITPTVKPEWALPDGRLDEAKVNEHYAKLPIGTIRDVQWLKIEKPVTIPTKIPGTPDDYKWVVAQYTPEGCQQTITLEKVDIFIAGAYLIQQYKKHRAGQLQLMEYMATTNHPLPKCPSCGNPQGFCNCDGRFLFVEQPVLPDTWIQGDEADSVSHQSFPTLLDNEHFGLRVIDEDVDPEDEPIDFHGLTADVVNSMETVSGILTASQSPSGLFAALSFSFAKCTYTMTKRAIIKALDDVSYVLFPSRYERIAADCSTYADWVLGYRKINNPTFGWLYNSMPTNLVASDYFQDFYNFMERKNVARLAKVIAALPNICVLALAMKLVSRRRSSKSNLGILAGCGITSLVIQAGAHAHARQAFEAELYKRQKDAHKVMNDTRDPTILQGKKRWPPHMVKFAVFVSVTGAMVTLATVVRNIYALYQADVNGEDSQAALISSDDGSHVDLRDSRKNVWYNPITPAKRAPGSIPEHVSNVVGKAQMFLTVKENSSGCGCVFMETGYMLMPYHMFFPDLNPSGTRFEEITIDLIRAPRYDGLKMEISGSVLKTKKLNWTSCYRLPGNDLVLVKLNTGPMPSVKDYLRDVDYAGQAITVHRNATGLIIKSSCSTIPESYLNSDWDLSYRCYATMNTVIWKAGDCMTSLISNAGDPALIGFHVMGSDNSRKGRAVSLTRTMYDEAVSHFVKGNVSIDQFHAAPTVPLIVCGKSIGFTDVKQDTPFNWIGCHVDAPEFLVYGHCKGGVSPTSEYRESPIAKAVLHEFSLKNIWAPANFRPIGPNGKPSKWIPWQSSLMDSCRPCYIADLHSLEWAARDYLLDLNEAFTRCDKPMVRTLDDSETINGVLGKRFIDRIDSSTSMGFPLTGVKRNYMKQLDLEGHLYDFTDPIIWEEVREAEQSYLKKQTKGFVAAVFLKDEIVKARNSKGQEKKARVVTACPIVLTLLVRKYFLGIFRMMSTNPLDTGCMVGVNCYGPEWDEWHNYLSTFTTNTAPFPSMTAKVVAGDYKAWDKRVPHELLAATWNLLIQFATHTGNFSKDELTIMRGIRDSVLNLFVNFNGTVVQFFGWMPSGLPGTAHINCAANNLWRRAGFYTIHKEIFKTIPPYRFSHVVKGGSYGDDFVDAPDIRKIPWYTITNLAKYMKSCDMELTMPDKTDHYVDYLPIMDCDFLKRKSVLVEGAAFNTYGAFLGCLDKDSIFKSLMYVKCRSPDTPNVVVSTVCSAAHEMFLHGESDYENFRTKMIAVLAKQNWICPALEATYADRLERWNGDYVADPNRENPTPGIQDDDFEFQGYKVTDMTLLGSNHGISSSGSMSKLPLMVSGLRSRLVTDSYENRSTKVYDKGKLCTVEVNSNPGAPEEMCVIDEFHAADMNSSESQAAPPLTTFDVNPGSQASAAVVTESTQMVSNPEGGLGQFFERPVLLDTFQWAMGAQVRELFYPLDAYLNNKYVVNRINNYSWLAGTMCMKFVINGTPYHYGKMVAGVHHWRAKDNVIQNTPDKACTLGQLMTLNHVVFNPTEATAGCLEIPLYYPYNYISLTDTDRWVEVVEVDIRTLNPLKAITPVPQMDLQVEVWAWFKTIELVGPTHVPNAYLVPQGSHESESFSSKATVLATNLGELGNAPVVGKYAQAASMAVGAMATVASAFGYSRPSADPKNTRIISTPIGNLANVNALDDCVNIGLDARNEVTIDPSVTGHANNDEMSIVDIGKREFYTYTSLWSYGPNAPIAYINVTPQQYKQLAVSSTAFIPSPSCHAVLPFKYWRGTVRIRVEVVASAFHQGKLRLVYDPTGKMNATDMSWMDEHNLNHSYIMDIGKEREYTMEIGWNNLRSYCRTYKLIIGGKNASNDSTVLDPSSDVFYNGRLGIHSLSPLSSINGPATPPVYVNIYVSMGDDFEVAVPFCTNITDDYVGSKMFLEETDSLAFQGAPIDNTPGGTSLGDGVSSHSVELNKIGMDDQTKLDKLAVVHLGERVRSVREVVKRYSHNGTFTPRRMVESSGVVMGNAYKIFIQYSNFPSYAGIAFSSTAELHESSAGFPVLQVPACNWLTWFTPCYLMRRGSIRNKYVWKFRTNGPYPVDWSINNVVREQGFSYGATLVNFTAPSKNSESIDGFDQSDCAFCGSDITAPDIRNTLAIQSPNQTTAKWFFAQERDFETFHTDDNNGDFSGSHKLRANMFFNNSAVPCNISRYAAAGDDFSLNCYKYAPIIVRAIL